MQSHIERELVVDALLIAMRRYPVARVIVRSDQGRQFGSYDWQSFLKSHGLVARMSRRGNDHDKDYASYCTSFATSDKSFVSRRRSDSLAPCVWSPVVRPCLQRLVLVAVGMAAQ